MTAGALKGAADGAKSELPRTQRTIRQSFASIMNSAGRSVREGSAGMGHSVRTFGSNISRSAVGVGRASASFGKFALRVTGTTAVIGKAVAALGSFVAAGALFIQSLT